MGIPVADAATAGAIASVTGTIAATSTIAQVKHAGEFTIEQGDEKTKLLQAKLEEVKNATNFLDRMRKWMQYYSMQISQFMTKVALKKSQWAASMAAMTARFAQFMATVAKFMPIIKVMMIILLLFSNFLQYLLMFIAAIIVSIILVIYKILDLPGLQQVIPGFIYWIIVYGIPCALIVIFYTLLLVVILVICGIFAAINSISPGSMEHFLFCEDGPLAWYQNTNYQFNNITSRGVLCTLPCRKGYIPNKSGNVCIPADPNSPDYCPQAEVMRIFSGYRDDKKYSYLDLSEDRNMTYKLKMPKDREDMLKKYFFDKKQYMEACRDTMRPYDHVTTTLCSNVDAMEKNGMYGLSKGDIAKLKRVCADSFCTSEQSYPFCAGIANKSVDDGDTLIQLLVKLGISILTFLIILFGLMDVTYSS